MHPTPLNDNGKALVGVIWAFAFVLLISVLAVVLTVFHLIKYPASAIDWPVAGPFIAQYGAIIGDDTEEETTEETAIPGISNTEGIVKMSEDPTAIYLRDISLKSQQIEDLNGQLESRGDKIAELEEEIQSLKTQIDQYKPENRKALIKIYDRMETPAAVEILSQLTPDRAVIILSSLKEAKAAEILATMDSSRAFLITQLMAGFTPDGSGKIQNPRDSQPPASPTSPVGPVSPAPITPHDDNEPSNTN
jgi:flagellar motility protein MotE (MotC chaperone)